MRTFTDITPPSRRGPESPIQSHDNPSRDVLQLPPRQQHFPYLTLIAVLVVIALAVGALFYFSSARVEVTPNTVSAAVQGSFTATESTGTLPFEIVTAQKIATQSVKGSGTKSVSTYASGVLTIYNTQTKAQQLVANTRFATGAGLIFRIRTGITIPGGSVEKPGMINIKVYADQPGSSYNIPPSSFTVPGFAKTPQATAVYGKSQSAMTGGASGVVPTVDAALESQTRAALVKALMPDLLASIQTQVPSGYILVNGAASTTFESLLSAPSATTGQVDVKEQGTITAIVFPNAALAKAMASSIAGLNYQGEPLTVAPSSTLALSAPSFPQGSTVSSFTFNLSGTAELIYTVDPTRIAAAVAGKTRSAAEVALTNYPEVKRAILILRPFWRGSFPQDPSTITVIVANP